MKKGPNWVQNAKIEADFKVEAEAGSEKFAGEVLNLKSITKRSVVIPSGSSAVFEPRETGWDASNDEDEDR